MKCRGFTLLELVVALSLLGVLSLLLADGLRLAARISRGLEERAAHAHDLHVAMHFVARQIERAQQLAGERGAMRFSAGGRSFALEGAEGSLRLVHEGKATILAEGLQDVQFDYLGRDDWGSGWSEEGRLPRLVRVRLSPGGELVAAPMLAVPQRER